MEILQSYPGVTSLVAKRLYKLTEQYEEQEQLLYDILGQLHEGQTIDKVIQNIKQKKFNWKNSFYKELNQERERIDKRLEQPPEVREGEIECPKCKTKKTVLVEMQIRRADEGFTYEIHCFNPKCKFVKRTDNF